MPQQTTTQLEARVALEDRLRHAPTDREGWAVYADALADVGDPRGELIALEQRAQGETRTDTTDTADTSAELRGRIEALYRWHSDTWTPACLTTTDAEVQIHWRGGFVAGLTFTDVRSPDQLACLPTLLRDPDQPFLTELRIEFGNYGRFSTRGRDLMRSTLGELELGRLQVLALAYHEQGDGVVDALVGLTGLELHTLDLRYASLSDNDLRRLLSGGALTGLRALHLQHNGLGPRAAQAVATSKALAKLELLDLRGNPIRTEGAAALAASSVLRQLRTLHVDIDDVEPEGLAALSRSSGLTPTLRRYLRGRARATGVPA